MCPIWKLPDNLENIRGLRHFVMPLQNSSFPHNQFPYYGCPVTCVYILSSALNTNHRLRWRRHFRLQQSVTLQSCWCWKTCSKITRFLYTDVQYLTVPSTHGSVILVVSTWWNCHHGYKLSEGCLPCMKHMGMTWLVVFFIWLQIPKDRAESLWFGLTKLLWWAKWPFKSLT